MKKTKKHAGTTLDADLAGYSATATATLAKTPRGKTLKRVVGFGAATSAALLAGTGVEAAIVYSGLVNHVLSPALNSLSTYGIDMDGGGDDFRAWANLFSSYSTVTFFSASLTALGSNKVATNTSGFSNYVKRFSSGQRIGTSGSSLGPHIENDHAFLSDGFYSSPGFAGVQLASGNFGWIQLHQGNNTLTIIDWAYDDSGAHIMAGDRGVVPEPALLGLGLLSLGAAGVRELRRRKREAAEKVNESTPTA